MSQLGFIDEKVKFDALEVTPLIGIEKAKIKYQELSNYSFITSSDAHFLKDVGKAKTKIILKEISVAELKMAFAVQNGRCVLE